MSLSAASLFVVGSIVYIVFHRKNQLSDSTSERLFYTLPRQLSFVIWCSWFSVPNNVHFVKYIIVLPAWWCWETLFAFLLSFSQ
jgi:hypothetical protein